MASHLVNPSIRFFLTRTSLRLRNTLLRNYAHVAKAKRGDGGDTQYDEAVMRMDAEKLVKSYKEYKVIQRFQPLWHPPSIMIGDILFMDILTSKLQESFMASVGALVNTLDSS